MFDPIELTKACLRVSVQKPEVARIVELNSHQAFVAGWKEKVHVGSVAHIRTEKGKSIKAEVVGSTSSQTILDLPNDRSGIRIGDLVWISDDVEIRPGDHWIGRTLDARGRPIDGRRLARLPEVESAPKMPGALERRPMGARLETGYFAFNTFLPIVKGQRLGIFAGSGVGKSTLLGGFAQNLEADVVVIALVGERGHEVRAFKEEILGPEGMKRAVLVASTSDQPATERRRSVDTATQVAEYFRDQGRHVLLLVDSITRLAEAHREIETDLGHPANCRGFPSSTQALVAGLCERAGPGPKVGSITALYTVLVAGSDMDEPIADMLRGILDGHLILDRRIAERGRFPAVDILRSVSRSIPHAVTEREAALLGAARRLLAVYSEAELMISSGLYTYGSNPEIDHAIAFFPKLEALLGSGDGASVKSCFEGLEKLLSA